MNVYVYLCLHLYLIIFIWQIKTSLIDIQCIHPYGFDPKKLLADHTVMDFVFVLVLLFAIVFVSSNTKRLSSISSAPTHIALTQIYSWQITLLIHLYLFVVCILIVSLSGKSKRVSSVSSTPVWLWPNILQADHPVLSLYLSHTKTMKTKSVEFGNQQSPVYPFNFGRIHVGTE